VRAVSYTVWTGGFEPGTSLAVEIAPAVACVHASISSRYLSV